MTGRGQHGAAVVNLNVVPAMALLRHRGRDLGIGLRQRLLGRLREDDAKAEGLIQRVALVERDLVPWVGLLEEEGQEESRRSAANGDDLHASASFSNRSAITTCWISVVPS